MGEVEIVIKVPEGVDPEEIIAKAKALAEWERILKAAEKESENWRSKWPKSWRERPKNSKNRWWGTWLIYVDANVIYNAIVETEPLRPQGIEIRGEGHLVDCDKRGGLHALQKNGRKKGFRTIYSIKEMPKRPAEGITRQSLPDGGAVSSGEGITSIPELQNEYVAHQISLECGLLPADAMILATALSHGINKIATLDRNFEAVKGLTTLLPREYWEV